MTSEYSNIVSDELKPFLNFFLVEENISRLIDQGQLDQAGHMIGELILHAVNTTEFLGRALYVNELDQLCVRLGSEVDSYGVETTNPSKKTPLILVTELYRTGGHSRIVEDLLQLFPDAEVWMTGYYPPTSNRDIALCQGIPTVDATQIPKDNLCYQIQRLRRMVIKRGSMVFHVAHHHDVVINAALSGVRHIPLFFMHHSDHQFSLGCTIENFIHVDLADHVHSICQHFLGSRSQLWPQGVSDHGRKIFEYPLEKIISATSGTLVKFTFEGPLSLPEIVRASLSSGAQLHYHIGPLEPAQLDQILNQLTRYSIDNLRFRYVESVTSLWDFLLKSDVNLFIGSAPMHGLRTAIEVQGCGIPILPFSQSGHPLLQERQHYPPGTVFWQSPTDLGKLFEVVNKTHQEISNQTRLHFEQNFSMRLMRNAIEASIQSFYKKSADHQSKAN